MVILGIIYKSLYIILGLLYKLVYILVPFFSFFLFQGIFLCRTFYFSYLLITIRSKRDLFLGTALTS